MNYLLPTYQFRDPNLARLAFTHRSFSADHNERLEFLGDTVLNCVVSEALYRIFPDLSEGKLSHLRASLVNRETLVELAVKLNLGKYLRLGAGERRAGGAERPSILADSTEALIGAIFLDGGFLEAQRIVGQWYQPYLQRISPDRSAKDAKTTLQEWLQGRKLGLPTYQILEILGEAHEQTFSVECLVESLDVRAVGSGPSRRTAEQQAAELALSVLENVPAGKRLLLGKSRTLGGKS